MLKGVKYLIFTHNYKWFEDKCKKTRGDKSDFISKHAIAKGVEVV